MTVADNTSRNQYTATSGQTVFAYTFEIVDKDHIVVLQNGTALSEGTDYTVSNVGNDNGGNITLTSGATAGDVMTLYRDMPYSRTQNYTNSGDFLASEVNADFDELWLAGEQTDRSFSQSIRKPITDSDSISMELPEAADRANKFVKFDATGAVDVAGATVTVSAEDVTIDDAGNYYTSDNVEGALQEVGASLDTKLENVVEDTTPQLGGDLDTNGNSINFGDNDRANFGDSQDLQLYHDGSNSYIYDQGTGYLVLQSGGPGIRLNKSNAEVMIDATPDGAVTLYHDNSAKIATSSTGVDITGTATVGAVTYTGTDGTDGQVLMTDGAGNATFEDMPSSTYLDVKDFGATGDGTTDDTTAIQNAINHASTRNIQTIFFPDGHYKYSVLRFYHDQTDNTGFQGTNIYTGDGSDTTFDFGWYIESASDLTVTVNDVEQTLDTDYTVSGVGSDTGGTVTFTTAPGNTLEVKIASPNRDGRFQLRGTGRLAINDLLRYTGSNTDRLYGSVLEATGAGIIVEPTGGFGTTDARNFVAKDISFVANNTTYIITSETCPGMTFDHCSFKQLNAGGSGLKIIGSWFFTMNQCYVFGAYDEDGTTPSTNTGDGITFGSDDFAGEWNIIDSSIDNWKNGLRWDSDQSFVNVSIRNTAIQNCNDYGILVDDGTIHQLLLDNVYFENQANKSNVGQGISYISDNSSEPGRIRNLRIINNFFLGIHGPATLATTTGPMIDLAVIDFIDIEGSFAYRPAKTFLNIDDTIDAQDICGEIKNTFFLTDRAFPTTPLFLLTGILPNVHNCRWPGYEDGIYDTTNDCQLFDSTTDGQYLREYTDPIMGSTNISKFSFGDSNVETVTSSPYTINDVGFNEAKTYYDLTHTLAGGLAVRLPDVNEKGDGRLFIIKNNENSASSFPYIQVYNNSDQVNFIARLSPGQAGLFIYDGQGTGTFKYVGRTFHDDIILADDHKITFGRSDDLQLFHQSSDSTNRLVSGGTSFALPTADGSAGQSLTTDGSGNLTFSTASGTGISAVVEDTTPQLGGDLDLNSHDITGTGNLDFTGSINTVLSVDGTTEDVFITGAVPALEFVESDNGDARMRMAFNSATMFQSLYGATTTTFGSFTLQTRASDGTSNQVVYAYDGGANDRHTWGTRAAGDVRMQLKSNGDFEVRGGDVIFENSARTSDDFYFDASTSRLGLGTTSPSYDLDVYSTIHIGNDGGSGFTHSRLILDSNGASRAAGIFSHNQVNDTEWFFGNPYDTPDSFAINRQSTTTHADSTANKTNSLVTVNSSGNVGIGTTNVPYKLVVSNGGASSVEIEPAYSGTSNLVQHYNRSGAAYVDAVNIAAQHRFNIGGSEAMRITSSGNLLVGKTGTGISTAGIELNSSGAIYATVDNERPLILNRKTADGSIAEFRKDNATVGSIRSRGGAVSTIILDPRSNGSGLTGSTNGLLPVDENGSISDDGIDLGSSTARFRDIYAGNGTIQTSDRNEKQDIEELSEAEQRVAVACKGLLRKFRWKSAVEKKGDDARIHFGIIAQDLQDAFTAEGLDAGRYGMFINSTWTDEETGEERSRMGVRYSELLAFIISAI